MSDIFTPFSGVIAGIIYLLACYIGVKNYRQTSGISDYWLVFSISMFLGAIVASLFVLKYISFFPDWSQRLAFPASIAFVTALIITAFEALVTRISVTMA